ncbi:MAG TPA: hypothetical protein VMU01_03545 [Rhizomicrobium sp.]|nr:hypothetical protein [Rhizomicrobium sp.]
MTTIDTGQPYYLESQVGTSVTADFQGGTLRDDRNGATDSNNYTVENYATNTVDTFGNTTTFTGNFSGAGPLTITDSAGGGTFVVTSGSAVSGAVTIDTGATMQWGAGSAAFLVGASNAVADNGSLVLDFGGGGIAGSVPISGSGNMEIESGSFNDSGACTYTGATVLDVGGKLILTGSGSIGGSSDVSDNGTFDISGTPAGTSIVSLSGAGEVDLGARTLTLTNASKTFSGILADGGDFGGTGGSLTIAGGSQTLTGTNTFTGTTTINSGGLLWLGDGGTTGSVAGNIIDNGQLWFNHSGSVTVAKTISGTGSITIVGGTVVMADSGTAGAVTIDSGATLQWGNGDPEYLLGGNNSVIDNGSLVLNLGNGGGLSGSIPIQGLGSVTIEEGTFTDSTASGYKGATTIASGGELVLYLTGSIGASSGVSNDGIFDISGATTGTSITTLLGSGQIRLGAKALTLTKASGTFAGLLADGGLVTGTGGGLTIAGGTEILTGDSTYTGTTTVNADATLQLGNGGTTGSVAGKIADKGQLQFDYSGTRTVANSIAGPGSVEVLGGTVILTGSSFVSGMASVQSGTLEFKNGGAASASEFAVASGATLQFGGGSFTMNGGTYDVAGATRVSAGTLTIDGGMTGSGYVVVNGGADFVVDASATTAANNVYVSGGSGAVTLTGGSGNDQFRFGSNFSASDEVNGGSGADTLTLVGDYSGGLTFGASTVLSIEKLVVLGGHSYKLTTNEATVASGKTLTVDASALEAPNWLYFDGSAETNGKFAITGGPGKDTLIGGTGNDTLTGGGGADLLTGGAGADAYAYSQASDSTGANFDTITGFNAAADKIDLWTKVYGTDAAVTTGKLWNSTFDANLTSILSGKLKAHHAVLVTPDGGTYAGKQFLVVDTNGVAGYQAGADLVIRLNAPVNLSSFNSGTFG